MFGTSRNNISPQLQKLIDILSKVQGLGPKSARRAVLQLLKKRDVLLAPLIDAMQAAHDEVCTCGICGNLDTSDPCAVCSNETRDHNVLCVIADVADLWAFERSGGFRGQYHVLGGLLNALDGISPSDLRIPQLIERIENGKINEVILALSATIDGQSTTHYLAEVLENKGVKVTRLSHGLPIGGELDHIDDGTLMAALKARREV
ncbi:recombination mediator RecR [Pseudaquidulcibacter saccharophilus]|uniref:recombination mediator RecR n=1 Tax=Pseudaquidulcibacter saccharophilus TaxID=2831900 RepID=UPI001EFF2B99|nr:recombination mediator RecR [Pseudaquidulcibacter saccharophilus]